MKRILAGLIVVLLAGAAVAARPVVAQTPDEAAFEKARAAYHAGDYATAFPAMKSLAEKGHAGAQFFVGEMYNGGLGVQEDTAIAIEWYQRSATQGNPDAIEMLDQGMRLMLER